MSIAPIFITCPERAQVFAQTLAYFGETDWAEKPHVQMDDSRSLDHRARQTRNAADHRYESVRADIRAWSRKVRPGGILAGHDCYTYAEVFNAVRDELQGRFVTTNENVWIHRVAS